MRTRVYLNWTGNLLTCSANLGYPHRGKGREVDSYPPFSFRSWKPKPSSGFPFRKPVQKSRKLANVECQSSGGGLETVCKLMPNQSECRIATQVPFVVFATCHFDHRPRNSFLYGAQATRLVILFCGIVGLPFLPFFVPTIDYSFIPHCFIGWCLFILLSFIFGNATDERIKKKMFRHTIY